MRLLLILCLFVGTNLMAQETKTSIGFVLSPNFSSVRYSMPDGKDQMTLDEAKANKNGVIGLSGNAFFQYELTDKLFVTWGLGVQNYRYAKSFSIDGYTSRSVYSQHYLGFNASVKYRIFNMLYVRAGAGVDFIVETRYKISNSYSEDYYHKGQDGSNFKEAIVPLSFGVGHELKLTDKLNLVSELFGTMVASSALDIEVNSGIIQRKPMQIGISLGVIRSF